MASSMATPNDDIILATVVGMVTYDMTIGDWKSYEVHLKYLRQAVISRGGAKALGWQGWIAYSYTWAELRWANYLASHAIGRRAELKYSIHPAVTDVSPWTLKLPIGFRNLVGSKLVGAKVGQLLVDVADWATHCKSSNTNLNSFGKLNKRGLELAWVFAKVLGSCLISQAEYFICVAITAYIISHIEGPAGHSRGLEDLTVNLDLLNPESLDIECRLWVAVTIAAANETVPMILPHRWTLLDSVMDTEEACQTWPLSIELFRKFFWDERHADRWKQRWDVAAERKQLRLLSSVRSAAWAQ
jgi:hypothetical protein